MAPGLLDMLKSGGGSGRKRPRHLRDEAGQGDGLGQGRQADAGGRRRDDDVVVPRDEVHPAPREKGRPSPRGSGGREGSPPSPQQDPAPSVTPQRGWPNPLGRSSNASTAGGFRQSPITGNSGETVPEPIPFAVGGGEGEGPQAEGGVQLVGLQLRDELRVHLGLQPRQLHRDGLRQRWRGRRHRSSQANPEGQVGNKGNSATNQPAARKTGGRGRS